MLKQMGIRQTLIFCVCFLWWLSLSPTVVYGSSLESPSGEAVHVEVKSSTKKKVKRLRPRQKLLPATAMYESAVYEKSNFDSIVKTFLKRGERIQYFPKKYEGPGGFGTFYKVRISSGEYGYIVEDNLKLLKKKRPSKESGEGDIGLEKGPFLSPGPFGEMGDESENKDSIYLSKWLGLFYGVVNYTEEIDSQKLSAASQMFGFRISMAPIDFNLMFSFGVPTYYQGFARSASGFLLISDLTTMFPFVEWDKVTLYFGLGPLVTYSHYSIRIEHSDGPWVSREVRAGFSFPLGLVWQLKRALIKAEAKYYFEKEMYFGFHLGLQIPY